MRSPHKIQRNGFIFNLWWTGASIGELVRIFTVNDRVIQTIIMSEIRNRRLGRLEEVKKIRNSHGKITDPPHSKYEIAELIFNVV